MTRNKVTKITDTQEDFTISVYVLIDDILKSIKHKADVRQLAPDSMILTTALVSARYYGNHHSRALSYIRSHHCDYMPKESRFNRRLHKLHGILVKIFYILSEVHISTNPLRTYLLDTFPMQVCHNIRISRCQLLKGEEYRGKCASKHIYYYGFKVAVLTNEAGAPIEFTFMPASRPEQSALHRLDFRLPDKSLVYGDAGFIDYEFEDTMMELENIEFRIARKKNSLRGDDFFTYTDKKVTRRTIEAHFSNLEKDMPHHIHATSIQGFLLKVACSIVAYSFIHLLFL